MECVDETDALESSIMLDVLTMKLQIAQILQILNVAASASKAHAERSSGSGIM